MRAQTGLALVATAVGAVIELIGAGAGAGAGAGGGGAFDFGAGAGAGGGAAMDEAEEVEGAEEEKAGAAGGCTVITVAPEGVVVTCADGGWVWDCTRAIESCNRLRSTSIRAAAGLAGVPIHTQNSESPIHPSIHNSIDSTNR